MTTARQALATLSIFVVAASGASDADARSERPKASGTSVVLVRVGDVPTSDIAMLARHYRSRFGLRVRIDSISRVPSVALNRKTRRVVGQHFVAWLANRHRAADVVVVGITRRDMEIGVPRKRRLAFAYRDDNRRTAVISTARMNPAFFGFPADRGLERRRAQKLATRHLVLLRFNTSPSSHPRSVVYSRPPTNLDQLDYATASIRPRETSAERAWRRGANAACKSAARATKTIAARKTIRHRGDFLAIARETLAVEQRLLGELRTASVHVQRRADVKRLIRLLRAATALDARGVATLERRWSEKSLLAWMRKSEQLNRAMRSLSLELGARTCGRYWNPLAYSRK